MYQIYDYLYTCKKGGIIIGNRRKRYRKDKGRSELLNSEVKTFIMGVGVGILGMALSPKLRDSVIPLTDSVVNNLKGYSGHIEEMKEKFQDMVAEAKFENIKQTIDQEVGEENNQ